MRVSEIGLGGSYLVGQSREMVVTTIRRAIACGINYFDFFYSFPDYLGNLGEALKGNYADIHLALHLGSSYEGNHYCRTRDPHECELLFDETLRVLGTDHADVLHISYVDWHEWSTIVESGGVLDLALKLRKEGRAVHIGMSTHSFEVAKRALGLPEIEVLMLPLNLTQYAMPGMDRILGTIQRMKVGVVAMKPFARGKLLQHGKKVKIPKYQAGGISADLKIPTGLTPIKCLSYILSQPWVCTTIPGVSSLDELRSILAYPSASREEKDYSRQLKKLFEEPVRA